MSDAYLVDIKPSARRASGGAARAVNEGGSRHGFPDRSEAERWAAELSDDEVTVWVRDANPNDSTPVDGYLMSWRGNRSGTGGDATPEGSQSTLADLAGPVPDGWESDDGGESTQSSLLDYSAEDR